MQQGLLIELFDELQSTYPGLILQKYEGFWNINGPLFFTASFDGQLIEDKYLIQIVVPDSFPCCVPKAYETGSQIPGHFHKYIDGSLCLGDPIAITKTFNAQPTLLGFVQNCLIPYLYSYSHYIQYGNLPWGELSHGELGRIEYFRDLFQVQNNYSLLHLISFIRLGEYRGHTLCPCGSKRRLRSCHGPQLLEILKTVPSSYLRNLHTSLFRTTRSR